MGILLLGLAASIIVGILLIALTQHTQAERIIRGTSGIYLFFSISLILLAAITIIVSRQGIEDSTGLVFFSLSGLALPLVTIIAMLGYWRLRRWGIFLYGLVVGIISLYVAAFFIFEKGFSPLALLITYFLSLIPFIIGVVYRKKFQ